MPWAAGSCTFPHRRSLVRSAHRPGPALCRPSLYTLDAPLTLPVVELLVAPSERKVQPAAPEEATLTLKKFADIPWVSFGDVPPGTSAVSSLHIVNPSKAEVHLTLERFPADKGAVHHVAARISLRSRRAQLIGGENVLCVP